MISQLLWLSQDSAQSSQILGFWYHIQPFSYSPNIQNMRKSDQIFPQVNKHLGFDKSIKQILKRQKISTQDQQIN